MSDPIEFADDGNSLSARKQDDELHLNGKAVATPCEDHVKDSQQKDDATEETAECKTAKSNSHEEPVPLKVCDSTELPSLVSDSGSKDGSPKSTDVDPQNLRPVPGSNRAPKPHGDFRGFRGTGVGSRAYAYHNRPAVPYGSPLRSYRPLPPQPMPFNAAGVEPVSFGLPLVYIAPGGTISVVLAHEVVVEISTDRTIRVVCHGKFAVAVDGVASQAAILARTCRTLQHNDKVDCAFIDHHEPTGQKLAVIGPQGVLFTMTHLKETFLVSSSLVKGTSTLPTDRIRFPDLNNDVTLRLFYSQSQSGPDLVPACNDIVQKAHHEKKDDGSMNLSINGLTIRQKQDGNVEVNSRPTHINCSPVTGAVSIRTHTVDMGVQDDEKAYVKRGTKRVHVSRSGMVVSDGNCITSMDHVGRIVSCT